MRIFGSILIIFLLPLCFAGEVKLLIPPTKATASPGKKIKVKFYLLNMSLDSVSAPKKSQLSYQRSTRFYKNVRGKLFEQGGQDGGVSSTVRSSSALAHGESREYEIEWECPKSFDDFDFVGLTLGLFIEGKFVW